MGALVEVFDLVGKLYSAMRNNPVSVESTDPHEMDTATVGDDIELLSDDEKAELSSNETQGLATLRLFEKQSQLIRLKGDRPTGRGPVLLLMDESRSMADQLTAGYKHMGRNAWSKAVSVALVRLAWEQGREVRGMHYSTIITQTKLDKGDYTALLDMILSFHNGYTDISVALKAALGEVDNMSAEGHPGADVIIIGDGEDGNLDDINSSIDQMANNGTALWTVNVGDNLAKNSPLRARAESYIFISDSEISRKRESAIDKLSHLGLSACNDTEFGAN